MNDQLKSIFEQQRNLMLSYEQIGKSIDEIKDDNFIAVRLKEGLKEYSNTVLSDMLIFSDFLYQLVDTVDSNEMELILQAFDEEVGDEEF